MIGVDRLDYSKGLPERIDGIARFFDRHPDRVRDLVFIQIAPPSREDIDSYQHIRETLEQKTGQINGARSEVDVVPIRYVNQGHSHGGALRLLPRRQDRPGHALARRDEPCRQGICRRAGPRRSRRADPLALRRRGAAADCDGEGALLVNPHSPDDIAHAIRLALDMPLEERKSRYEKMIVTVRDENVQRWTENFITDLA